MNRFFHPDICPAQGRTINFEKLVIGFVIAIICLFSPSAQAQYATTHTMHAILTTPPSGKNSMMAISLTMSPADVDVSGFGIDFGYDDRQITFMGATDNTGQTTAGVLYDFSPTTYTLTGVPYARVYYHMIMSTLHDLPTPVNLAKLNFKTTAAFDDTSTSVSLFIRGYSRTGGSGGITKGLPDRIVIPTDYDPLIQTVPVTLSGFIVE